MEQISRRRQIVIAVHSTLTVAPFDKQLTPAIAHDLDLIRAFPESRGGTTDTADGAKFTLDLYRG